MTNVDTCELHKKECDITNVDVVRTLVESCIKNDIHLIHLSTDFIFDGMQATPYVEIDKTNPLGVYGQSKLEGELAVQDVLPAATILRTAWVYGSHGSSNFVKTMLRVAATGKPLRVVKDQIGSPTWTTDISAAILALVGKGETGVFNYTNAGETSWHGFATAILEEASALGFDIKTEIIEPIPASEYPTPARRPAYSVLDTSKIENCLDLPIPQWRDSLRKMLKELKTCADC